MGKGKLEHREKRKSKHRGGRGNRSMEGKREIRKYRGKGKLKHRGGRGIEA